MARNIAVIFVGSLVVLAIVEASNLPNYISACKRSAVDLNECAIRNGQAAIQSLVLGDKAYRIPKMSPLKLSHIEFDASKSLKISIKNAEIFGLEKTQVKGAKFDLNAQNLNFDVFIPQAVLIGEYDIKGRILILPIQGKGAANITLVAGTFNYHVDYDFEDKNGEQYLKIRKSEIKYDSKRTYFHLDNLFNGDKRLGDEMNNFINENWREVSKDIGPALSETISQVITQILSNILKKVPYDILLPA